MSQLTTNLRSIQDGAPFGSFYHSLWIWLIRSLQVRADASNFAGGISKAEAYAQVIERASALFEEQRNWVRKRRYFPTNPLYESDPFLDLKSAIWHIHSSGNGPFLSLLKLFMNKQIGSPMAPVT
jgi:hypothetical protein